jgi:excisionase family DNA binding protein
MMCGTTALSMNPPGSPKEYLNASEFSARTGMSKSTIWRLKLAGKLPFYQPGGRNSLVLFPRDALELAATETAQSEPTEAISTTSKNKEKPLPGPRPDWMKKTKI